MNGQRPVDMVHGASIALLSILRARRPDLSWEVRELDFDERTNGSASPGSVRAMIRGHDRPLTALSHPDTTDRAA